MKFTIGTVELGDSPEGPDPGPSESEWHKANIIEVKQIPGKGKKFKTVRTSDGVLWECTLTVKSISDDRYQELKNLVDDGGPFLVDCYHGMYNMYVTDGKATKKSGERDPGSEDTIESPGQSGPGGVGYRTFETNYATWSLTLLEAND